MPTPKSSKAKSSATFTPRLTTRLLRRAHSPSTADSIHAEKIKHKPLILHSTHAPTKPILSTASSATPRVKKDGGKVKDARELRREARNAKLEAHGKRRKRKPRPLSAREKRRLCVYEIPDAEKKYELYVGLHQMWCQYMRGVLGVDNKKRLSSSVESVQDTEGAENGPVAGQQMPKKSVHLILQNVGPLLVSADFHGAELEVVRCRSVSRVGLKGIVVRDTKFTFEIITKGDEIKVIPKEHSVFKFQVPLDDEAGQDNTVGPEGSNSLESTDETLVFELYGDQFRNRAPDRASKRFKVHIQPDL